MWPHGLTEPLIMGNDVVQVNIYGATLNEMLHKGVNLPHLLRRYGFERCVVFDVPRPNMGATERFLRSPMNDPFDVEELTQNQLTPPSVAKIMEEFDAEPYAEPRVVCSTPIHDDNPPMDCSLSTIRSVVEDGMLESEGGFIEDDEFEEKGLNKEYFAPVANGPETSYEDTFESSCSCTPLTKLFDDSMEDELFDFSMGDSSFYDDIPEGERGDASFSGGVATGGGEVFDAGDGPKDESVVEKKKDIDAGEESDGRPPPKKRCQQKAGDEVSATEYVCHFHGCGMKINWRPGYGRNRLLRHMIGVHCYKKPWKCRFCGHQTSSEQYMVYHHRSKHTDVPYEKPENCKTFEDVQTMLDFWEACFPEMPPPRITKLLGAF